MATSFEKYPMLYNGDIICHGNICYVIPMDELVCQLLCLYQESTRCKIDEMYLKQKQECIVLNVLFKIIVMPCYKSFAILKCIHVLNIYLKFMKIIFVLIYHAFVCVLNCAHCHLLCHFRDLNFPKCTILYLT